MSKSERPDKAVSTVTLADALSIDSIVAAAYDCISGPAGRKRDWSRLRSLFIPGARLIPTAQKPGEATDGRKIAPQLLDVDGFIARVAEHVEANGFFEQEVARRTEQFGRIAHVWSTYESRREANDPQPFMRGINSIQLFHDGKRWWIVSIYWQQETTDYPIPGKYFESVKE